MHAQRQHVDHDAGVSKQPPAPGSVSSTAAAIDARALQAMVDDAVRESHGAAAGLPAVTLDSRLDSDLGFDSLARTELLLRTERAFGIRLPDDTLQRAETVGDLLFAAQRAERAPATVRAREPLPTDTLRPDTVPDTDAPATAQTLLDALEWHLHAHPGRRHLTCLEGETEQAFSYRQVDDAAAAVAFGLQRAGG
jgi:acyl carrier protein